MLFTFFCGKLQNKKYRWCMHCAVELLSAAAASFVHQITTVLLLSIRLWARLVLHLVNAFRNAVPFATII
jgi:hypothetical protein